MLLAFLSVFLGHPFCCHSSSCLVNPVFKTFILLVFLSIYFSIYFGLEPLSPRSVLWSFCFLYVLVYFFIFLNERSVSNKKKSIHFSILMLDWVPEAVYSDIKFYGLYIFSLIHDQLKGS